MTKQIKSKQRVTDFGEVYTNEREVNAMLDLVKHEANRIESRFLEPAAGNGNFLIKILERKLKTVRRRYKQSQSEYECYAFLAVSSIYGIDILEDNIQECRDRLFAYVKKQYRSIYKTACSEEFLNAIQYLLSKNMICGDGLTGLKMGESAEPILFSEWALVKNKVKRRDFAMCDMIAYEEFHTEKRPVLKARKEYPLISLKEVAQLEYV